MFERTKKQLEEALRCAEKLVKAENHDPKNIQKVPKDIGVYLWRCKRTNEIVYVGSAIGKNGLYQRIVGQHLTDSYTKLSKNELVAKSVFRNQIAEEYRLNPKEESVSFIKNNFVLSFIPFKDEIIASLVEILLIIEYSPKYNRKYKGKQGSVGK